MFHTTTYTVLSTLIICSAAWAADAPTDPKIATNITITGCLHAGETSGQFVLLGVTEKTATGGVLPVPYAIYRLDSGRDMKPLVGQLVDIKGVVVKRYAKAGTIKISLQDDAGTTPEVKVESGSGRVASTKDFAEKSAGDTMIEVSRPVYQVNVDSIAAVDPEHAGPACK